MSSKKSEFREKKLVSSKKERVSSKKSEFRVRIGVAG